MRNHFIRMTAVLLATALVAGCAAMEGISTQSSLGNADRLAAAKSLAGVPTSAAAWPTSDWWKQFKDPQLDQLVDEARTRKAIAAADVSRSARYPPLDANLQMTRERFPENGLFPPPEAGAWGSLNTLQATLSWEIDLWGKNRAAYESALGEARASDIDAYAARLALSVAIAQSYVDLQRAYLQLDVAE